MTDNDWRNARIEEAAMKRYPHRNVFLEGGAYMSEERSRIPLREAFVEGAKWHAEKALGEATVTPTDDEREAPLDSERLRQLAEWLAMNQGHEETAKRVNNIADRLDRLAGFRRSEVPEPKCQHGTPLSDLCEHVERLVNAEQGESSNLVRRLIDLRGDMRHNADEVATLDAAITALRAKGEPSDAQVDAAASAWSVAYHRYATPHVAMRAALRSAGRVR